MLITLLLFSSFYGGTGKLPITGPFRPGQATACALVSKVDVEQAIGILINEAHGETEGRASTCDYAGDGGLVSITVQRLAAKPNLPVEIVALKKEIPEGVVRDASGFPEAFYFDLPDAGTQLHIIHDNSTHLMISILGFGDASRVSAAAAQIARKAIAKLRP
ncbi:MAG: hypothetical protein JO099_13545 [Acidobacteriia bacterium]|nr:hypothetical protein [Terriglobia bacterium]